MWLTSLDMWLTSLDAKHLALVSGAAGAIFGFLGSIVGRILQGKIDDANQQRRLRYEADIARQTNLINAQEAMLDALSTALWDWRYITMRLAYYSYNSGNIDINEYEIASKKYKSQIWTILNKIRLTAARSRRLIS